MTNFSDTYSQIDTCNELPKCPWSTIARQTWPTLSSNIHNARWIWPDEFRWVPFARLQTNFPIVPVKPKNVRPCRRIFPIAFPRSQLAEKRRASTARNRRADTDTGSSQWLNWHGATNRLAGCLQPRSNTSISPPHSCTSWLRKSLWRNFTVAAAAAAASVFVVTQSSYPTFSSSLDTRIPNSRVGF